MKNGPTTILEVEEILQKDYPQEYQIFESVINAAKAGEQQKARALLHDSNLTNTQKEKIGHYNERRNALFTAVAESAHLEKKAAQTQLNLASQKIKYHLAKKHENHEKITQSEANLEKGNTLLFQAQQEKNQFINQATQKFAQQLQQPTHSNHSTKEEKRICCITQ